MRSLSRLRFHSQGSVFATAASRRQNPYPTSINFPFMELGSELISARLSPLWLSSRHRSEDCCVGGAILLAPVGYPTWDNASLNLHYA
jgi:hypothetical protein